jgi:hypothetical protein
MESLKTKGYAIIEGVLTPEQIQVARGYFDTWLAENPQVSEKHKSNDPHGIFKFCHVGHQKFAWYLRTLDSVQKVFRDLWKTDDLVVGFDGCCWLPSDYKYRLDPSWTHTDQAPNQKGLVCVQSFIALTDNTERTLRVYEKSHLMHELYMEHYKLSGSKNWIRIEQDFLNMIESQKRVLKVPAGAMVLWDSRCFHQNQYGPPGCKEERLVQYICFLPRSGDTKKQHEKRLKYFKELRTTSHWPYPIHVNGLQPQTYGDESKLYNYDLLSRPDLEEFRDKISLIL